MASAHSKPRAGSSALVAGVTLFEKSTGRAGAEGYARLVVRASAQVSGKPKRITRSVEKHGLEEALRQVCQWRFEHAQPVGYESAEDLYEGALAGAREAPMSRDYTAEQ